MVKVSPVVGDLSALRSLGDMGAVCGMRGCCVWPVRGLEEEGAVLCVKEFRLFFAWQSIASRRRTVVTLVVDM